MIRLLGERILVKLDKPLQGRDLGDGVILHYPAGTHGSQDEINVWGTVLSTGPGKFAKSKAGTELGFRIPMEVNPGDRVNVIWYLTKVETNRALQEILGEDTIIVTPADIIAVDPA